MVGQEIRGQQICQKFYVLESSDGVDIRPTEQSGRPA